MRAFAFLHGFTGHAEDWQAVAAQLPAGTSGAAEPLLGHGGGGQATADSFGAEVDRLADRIRRASAEPVHLVGYSMGARLALGLLVGHPELFNRATLVGGQPGLRTEPERNARRREDARWIELLGQGGVQRFADAWEAQPLFASQKRLPAEVLEPVRARRRRHDPDGLARALEVLGLGAMPDLWPLLPQIAVPVTLVHGELDAKFGALAGQMAASIPGARVASVRGAGHNPMLEQPRAVAELIST